MHDDLRTAGQMLDAIVQVERIAGGRSREALFADEVSYLAVLHLIQTVGEAARRTSRPFREAHPEIPWRGVIGMRDRIVHGYDDVRDEFVWAAVSAGVHQLRSALEAIVPPARPQ